MRCDLQGQTSKSDTAAPVYLSQDMCLRGPDPSVTLQGPFRKARWGGPLGIGERPGESQLPQPLTFVSQFLEPVMGMRKPSK